MVVWPAVDLLGGRGVRLVQGRREDATDYGDPVELRERWRPAGRIHVVDLDGAFAGHPVQHALIGRLADGFEVQAGGGVRTIDDVAALRDAGVSRVVIGTQAFASPTFLDACLARLGPEAIVVAADVKDGCIAARGWVDTFALSAADAAVQLRAQGAVHVLVTAVVRDGTLAGPDFAIMGAFQAAGLQVIVSGGIGTLEDVHACRGYAGVIVGKALYAGRFTLAEALAAC